MSPVFHLLRWIGARVPGFHAGVGLFLVVGLLVVAAALAAFAAIALLVAEGATRRMDHAVLLWLHARATPALDTAALELTSLGSAYVVWVVLLVASIFLWMTRHRYSTALLWVAAAGGLLLNRALKGLFDRPRPDLFEWRTAHAPHSSFPSGHSMTAMVVYATLAYLIVRLEPTRALRRVTLLSFALVILLVGLSRLYLGVHYPSDVLAGFVAGLAWATCCALGIEALRHFRERAPRVDEHERDLESGTRPIRDALEPHPEEGEGVKG